MNMRNSVLFLHVLLLCSGCQAQAGFFSSFFGKKSQDDCVDCGDKAPNSTLSNNEVLPLIGLGVGNLETGQAEKMVFEGLKTDSQIHLIDTAHVSGNEAEVAKGISSGMKNLRDSGKLDKGVQVHVVTKIWYTHLGYERTKLSVRESLEALSDAANEPDVDLKVHFLIQWPKCYDAIEWMNCQQEEDELPAHVKEAGPSPLMNKSNAWKESWKALEDMYNSGDYPAMAGLGVSNFGSEEMRELIRVARVKPHLVQMGIWSLLLDPQLVGICHFHDIQIQVFNVMHGILGNAPSTPHAYHHLLMIANQLGKQSSSTVTGAQVVLKWLVQQDVSVVPRTASLERLEENSVVSLTSIPDLSEEQSKVVANAMEAMLTGTDLEEDVHVKVTFHAKNQDMFLYFFPGMDESTEKQVTYIGKGTSFEEHTHPEHSFRIYNAYDPDQFHNYTVEGNYGDHQHVEVEM